MEMKKIHLVVLIEEHEMGWLFAYHGESHAGSI